MCGKSQVLISFCDGACSFCVVYSSVHCAPVSSVVICICTFVAVSAWA